MWCGEVIKVTPVFPPGSAPSVGREPKVRVISHPLCTPWMNGAIGNLIHFTMKKVYIWVDVL